MAESVYSQILAGIRTRFLSIVGDGGATWWMTPHAVVIFPALTEQCLRSSLGVADAAGNITEPAVIYVISPGPEEKAGATLGRNGSQRAVMTVDITLARYFLGIEDPHTPPVPDRITVQSRLIRDAEKALLKDIADGVQPLFGVNGCVGIEVSPADRTAENTWEEKWALAFLSAQVSYFYPVGTP